jgi:Mg-chelatase subunit ChlD
MGDDFGRFDLLASFIVGREVCVVAGDGSRAYAGRAAIHLPNAIPTDDARLAVLAQAALLRAGSLETNIVRELRHHKVLARRYLALEIPRAWASVVTIAPSFASLAKPQRAVATSNPADSLRAARGLRGIAELPWWYGTVRTEQFFGPGLANVEYRAANEPRLSETSSAFEEADDGGFATPSLFDIPGSKGSTARLFHRPRSGRRSLKGAGAEAIEGLLRNVAQVSQRPALLGLELPIAVVEEGTRAVDAWKLPEWDDRVARYRDAWCSVMIRSENMGPAGATAPFFAQPDRNVRRAVAPLGRGLRAVRRRPVGTDIDVDAYVDARCSFAGHDDLMDDVYIELRRERRDLGVLVLLDSSGSAAGCTGGLSSVHEEQRSLAAALIEAFEAVDDRVAAYGFRSHGRRAVDLIQLKGFDDNLMTALGPLANLEPAGFTRLGAAVRAATAIIDAAAGTPRRLLLIISDGLPYDQGYEGRYAEADSRRAILEARARGVGVACIAMRSATDDSVLRSVFGASAFMYGQDRDHVAQLLAPLLARALSGAAG